VTSVLIVDDEPFIHQLYKDILEFNGYQVMAEAYDGLEAIEIYSSLEKKPDVIIMDHRMPNKDGVDTTIKIREMDPAAKIIFASADTTIRERALDAGATGFLSKPFQINELVSALHEME
jgi:two-component system chemotaxis response regulator CheY